MTERAITTRKRAMKAVARARLQALNGFFTEEQISELEKLMDQVERLAA